MKIYKHSTIWILIIVASSITHAMEEERRSLQEARFNKSRNCIEKEGEALLKFSKRIIGRYVNLDSWILGSEPCCHWQGITCDEKTGYVIELNLVPGQFRPYDRTDRSDRTMLGNINTSALNELKQLRVLELSGNAFTVSDLDWLSSHPSLRYLGLSGLNLSQASDWLISTSKAPSLEKLFLAKCHLPNVNPTSVEHHLGNFSNSLKVMDISHNDDLDSSTFHSVVRIHTNNLVDLRVRRCEKLRGQIIPGVISNLSGLKILDLSGNRFEGGVPKSFQKLCSLQILFLRNNSLSDRLETSIENLSCSKETLKYLDLSNNPFPGQFPNFTAYSSLIELKIDGANVGGTLAGNLDHLSKLETLSLAHNCLTGSVPGFTGLSSLKRLDISDNLLNETIAESFGLLSSLQVLLLHNNSFNGVLTEKHFSNLSSLQVLNFESNSLTLNLSSDWTPPFQLQEVNVNSCKVGPNFPGWLFKNQSQLRNLYMYDAGIDDSFPNYFRNASSSLEILDLSFNQIHGQFPDLSSNIFLVGEIDLSSNQFSGPLPQFPPNVMSMILSDNMFSGTASSLCPTRSLKLYELDISNNKLSGEFPDCWTKFERLEYLNMEKNRFFGKLPPSLALRRISILILRDNNLSGGIWSLRNATNLLHLDLGDNILSGNLPEWLGESMKSLSVLRLRSNRFNGTIPTGLCGLISLHVLDFSQNNLSGTLPNCLSNILGMVNGSLMRPSHYQDSINVTWKGKEAKFERSIELMESFDISKNQLSGEIPESITTLLKLKSLNLSRNNFSGRIPFNISRLEDLEVLDFSMNQLSGEIPASVSSMHFLNCLNLSYNKLTGKIPLGTQMSTFEASSYIGNAGLFGPPLTADLPISNATNDRSDFRSHSKGNDDEYVTVGFYVSLVVGFVVGFWGICGFSFFRRSWRYAYFGLWNKVADWFYVTTRLYKARLLRRFTISANK